MMIENPYQTPGVDEVAAPLPRGSGERLIRQEHLQHEVSIRGMGALFLIGGVVMVLLLVSMVGESGYRMGSGIDLVFFVVFLGLIPLQFVTGWGLRGLRPWATIPAAILSGLGLLAIGIGTIISIYFLYLLFCRKGRMVLSPAYQDVIARTPGMKYRTPTWNWIVLGILVLLLIGFVAFAMFSN